MSRDARIDRCAALEPRGRSWLRGLAGTLALLALLFGSPLASAHDFGTSGQGGTGEQDGARAGS